jgi:hypothetical protein
MLMNSKMSVQGSKSVLSRKGVPPATSQRSVVVRSGEGKPAAPKMLDVSPVPSGCCS